MNNMNNTKFHYFTIENFSKPISKFIAKKSSKISTLQNKLGNQNIKPIRFIKRLLLIRVAIINPHNAKLNLGNTLLLKNL